MASGSKTLAKVGAGSTVKSAVAGSATGTPFWLSSLVVLVKVPASADSGTSKSTSMVHDSSGPRLPPVNVSEEVPLIEEPEPQTSVSGRPVATRPVITASRSSVKRRSETPLASSLLVMVNESTGVPVVVVRPSKLLEKVSMTSLTSRSSVAGFLPKVEPLLLPSLSPMRALVVLV